MELSQLRLGKAPRDMPASFDFNSDKSTRLSEVNIVLQRTSVDIFSNNLIKIITNAGTVNWTLVPARFFKSPTEFEVSIGFFSAVFFEYFSDFFDYENSEYKFLRPDHPLERQRKKVVSVKKLILKEPEDGFPPYFKLLALPRKNLINEKTHDAILAAGITNIKMTLIGDF